MAAANQKQWIKGRAKVKGAEENILLGSHSLDNHDLKGNYSYISDYDCIFDNPPDLDGYDEQQRQDLHDAKQRGTNITINNLAHFTKRADLIINSEGFIGGWKKINEDENGHEIEETLSWWSPIFTEEDKKLVRDTLDDAIRPFCSDIDVSEDLKNQFATSHAFEPNAARYGSTYFEYNINELCEQYGNYRAIGEETKIQYKILGTYVYKCEIMYAVLVCTNRDEQFAGYPKVRVMAEADGNDDGNNQVVIRRHDGGNWSWIWKPQATATVIKRLDRFDISPMYRRWEHVAFAFYTPDGQVFNLPDLQNHRHEL